MILRLCQVDRDPQIDARRRARLLLNPLRCGSRKCSTNILLNVVSLMVYPVIVTGSIWTFDALSKVTGDPLIALILMGVGLVIVMPLGMRRDGVR